MKSNTAGNVPSVDLPSWAAHACHELQAIVGAIAVEDIDALCGLLAQAGVIAVHGLGREGLMMRAFSMRLFHLGLRATPVGDMALPAVGAGDLLVASAGPGHGRPQSICPHIRRRYITNLVRYVIVRPDQGYESVAWGRIFFDKSVKNA